MRATIGEVRLFDTTVSASGFGALTLLDARVDGDLIFARVSLTNREGRALAAPRATIKGALLGDQHTAATGSANDEDRIGVKANQDRTETYGEKIGIDLTAVHIGHDVVLKQTTVRALTSSARTAGAAEVGGNFILDDIFTAISGGGGVNPTIDLFCLQVGHLLLGPDDNRHIEHLGEAHDTRWLVDGLTYTGLPELGTRQRWTRLLSWSMPYYAPQPYQHLAAAYRAAGADRNAREVLIAQRHDEIARGDLGPWARRWARTTGVLLGFGWKPWRALYGLAATFLVSVALAVSLGAHGALVVPPPVSTSPEQAEALARPCTVVERVGVGLDLGTPVLGSATRSRDRCPISSDPHSASAAALTVCTWVLQALAWAWAALFVAGFTSAVRKT